MAYRLRCDSCDFDSTVDREAAAYGDARGHEDRHPDHFVVITVE